MKKLISKSHKLNYWIFQANPQNIDLSKKYDDFSVRERKYELNPNDLIWFRLTGNNNGFYAIGRILTHAEPRKNLFGNWTCVYEIQKLIDSPLFIKDIKDHPVLGKEKNIIGRQYNNQKINREIHLSLLELSKKRLINL